MDEELKGQVIATYQAYIDAFVANDVEALDRLIQYPFAYIGNGRVTMVETYPVQPAELRTAKQCQYAASQQIIVRPAIHLALDGLEAVDLPFNRAQKRAVARIASKALQKSV